MRKLLLLLAAAVAACTADETDRCADVVCTGSARCDPSTGACVPAACPAIEPWDGATPAFREVGLAWGLEAVEGVRLSAVDFDGDGLADLSVRRAGVHADDFAPGGTRATWLLRNEGGTRFVDVTEASGIVARRDGGATGRPGEIVVFADVDGDGDLDAFTAFGATADTPESAEIVLNDGTGRFALGPADNPIRRAGEVAPRAGAAFVDFDRDGVIDLWVTNGASGGTPQQDRLWRGRGDGTFEDVTAAVGLTTRPWSSVQALNEARAHSNAWSAAACDLNDDGWPELLAASYGRAPNHLWLGGPEGFTNRSVASGYAFDDRQDWTDNESARCWCMHHRDDPGCEGVPEPEYIACQSDRGLRWDHAYDREPFRLGGNSGTTVCADVNDDGAIDLLTTEIVHWDVGSSSDPSELLINTGDPQVRFERPGNEATGLVRERDRIDWNDGDMTAAVFDFDNDGRQDVWIGSSDYPGTRGLLFHQGADGRFASVPPSIGIDSLAAHGVAVADFDRDGDLDVAVGHSRMRCEDQCYETGRVRLFENLVGNRSNWIQIRLEGGPGTNRSAIGARVRVRTGERVQTREVGGGHGHYGVQHELAVHFGLGEACRADVEIVWPDAARTTERYELEAGARWFVRQGEVPVREPPPGQ